MRGARRWLAVLAVAGVLASAASVPLSTAHAADTPLTASFAGVPSAHDGVSPFSFDLVFSEPASIGYATLRDDSFTVTGATVTGARRIDGRSDRWKITVAPDVPTATDAVGDISIELAATSDCDDEGAVCTAGDAKALSNTATATVAAPPPLTAELEEVPATHDTSAAFSFRLRFDTAVTTSYRILGDTAFDVTGGSVTGARRVEGRSDLWQITVQPDTVTDDTVDDDITITLPATEDCTDTDAVCTAALRPLSEPVTASVEGPLVEAEQNSERGRRVTRGIPGDKEDEEEDRVGVRAAPDPPWRLRTVGDDTELDLWWRAPLDNGGSAITGYGVQYKLASSSTWLESTHTGTDRTHTITGLDNYALYDVRVQAINADGSSAWTVESGRSAAPREDLTSDNTNPRGVAGNDDTVWVLDATDDHVYAYTRSTWAADDTKDIDLVSDNGQPTGLCMSDGFFWVPDSTFSRRKVYAYDASTRAHSTSRTFNLHSDNVSPGPVTCTDTTIWVVDFADDTLYAYNASDGTRDDTKDIEYATHVTSEGGVGTDGTHMWIADTSATTAEAFTLAGARQTDLDISYGSAGTTGAPALWADGTNMWIANGPAGSIYYLHQFTIPTAAAAPSVPQNLSFVSSNESLVLAWDAVTSDPEVTNYVVQYRVEGTMDWTTWTREVGDALETEETIDGLTNYTVYEVQVAARNGDTDEAIGDYATIDRAMPSVNHDAVLGTGLWSDGTTYWVLRSSQGEAKAYTLASGARQSGKDVEFQDANSEQSTGDGICSDGTTTWVSGESLNKIYAYEHALDDGSLAYTSDKDIDTGSGSTPAGLWCDEDTLLVVANNGHEVRVYDLPSRDRDSARNIDGLTNAFGVWSDGVTIWVSQGNPGSTAINAYSALDGARREWLDIKNLDAAAATNLRGLWSDDNHMWVVHIIPHRVFKFPLPQYGDGPPVPRSAEVSAGGTTVKVTFTEALATGVTPAVERFEVTVGSDTVTLDSVAHTSGDATSVTLTLPDAAGEGVAVTVAYNDPDGEQTTGVVQDAGGADAPSFTKLSATPRAVTAPGAPTALMADPGDASLTVTWSLPTTGGEPASYGVRHRETADPDMDSSYTTVMRGDAATSETITGLTNGTGYTVQVNATNTAGTSAWASVTGTPAAATTDVVLVSNIGLDSDVDPRPVQTSETAKGFTTGSHAHDYNLTSVELDVLRTPTSIENLVVQIWSSTTVSGNTVPDDSVITLTNPASLTQGANTFAAPEDSVLDAGTSYFVFVSSDSSHHSLGLYTVTSGNETAADTTGLTGWAILEARIRDRGSNDSWVANTGANFQFRLKGSEAAAGVVPAAPTGVTAAAGNKSLLVGWSAVTAMPRVTGYKIQYRPADSSDAWTEWTGTIAADATSETVTGLTEWVSYDVQVRAVNRTGDGAWSNTATGTAHRDVTLSAAGSVDGLGSDGTTLWTTVPGSNIALAYTLSNGTADTTKNITFATDTAPTGICAHGTRVWVAQSNSTTLQAYDNTDDTRQSAKDVTLPTGTNPVAVFCNDSYLFVAHDDTSGNDDAVLSYKDDLDGSYDRIMDKDVEGLEAAGNANPAGLSIDGDILWVSDSVDNKAYAYSTTTGRRLADMDLDLRSAVGTAAGIWGDTATLWAADADATATEIDSSRRPQATDGDPDVWHATMENDSSTKMRVEFSEVLDGTSTPPTSAFTVMAGTDTVAVDSVVHLDTSDGPILKTLVLTLPSGVPAGTTVTVSYTDPNPGSNDATDVVQDLDGNDAPSFSGYRVWSLPGGLPGGVSVVPGDGELEVSWDAAADTGRRPAGTSYQVQYKLSTATGWTTLNRSGDDNPEVSPAPDVVLVSNIGLDSDIDPRPVQTSETAKGFTTGSHGDGYNLTSVELDVLRPPTSIENLVVQIWSSTTVSGNTVPDDSVITLTNPALLTQGANTFAAPEDSVLDAGTSYFVFVSSDSSHHSLGLYTVTSGNETAADTTGLTGWAILEARIRDRGSSDSWVANTGANFQFRLNGSEAAFVVGQTITVPTNGSQHDVRVRAENNVGDGPYSAVVRATPSAGPLVEVDAGSADNTFKATDNKSGPTTWHYAWIAGTAVCDSTTTFPDMSNYTEGDNLTYTSTQNTNKACFRSTEGTNSGYAVSEVVVTNAASSDATLSALTLVEGSNSVTLTPTFASGTTAYRAWVANGVSSVTVTATKNDSEASVAITGDSDTSTPNTAAVSLEEGANTITVTVTAADTTTTGTYTITAVREASAPTADPTALMTEKMTAAQDGTNDIYGYQRVGANYGALTGNAFEFNGATETITNLFWNGPNGDATLGFDRLYLCFDSLPSNSDHDLWTLRVGSDDYRLADGQRVGTTYCFRWARDVAWAHGDVVTVKMFGNHAATGAPGVSGTAQVGQTLTLSKSGIADRDGRTKAEAGELGFAYGYQWVRVDSDGTNPVDISGATSVTYVPVKADVGKKVMVEVTFTDDRSNEEELTSAAYPAAGRILNDVPPMLDTATVNGVSLVLTYDRALDGDSDPAVGSYTVAVAGADVTLTGVDAAGRTVTLTLATAVTSGQSVTLDYRVPTMSPVQDSDGTPAGALDGQAVHNVVGDTTVPTLGSARVDGDVLVLSYSEALDSGSEPAVGQFDVQVTPSGGSASRRTVSTVDVSGSKVTLTLASAVDLDDSVTLSYEKPTSNPLQDVAGNDAAALDDQGVINNNQPMFAQATLTREITENTAANVNVGAVIPAATGGADGATLVYSMEGTDAASFNFNATTRQITTKTGVTYDYEDKTSYEVTIKVNDGTDNDTVTVTINVENLPTISIEAVQERILLSDGQFTFDVKADSRPSVDLSIPSVEAQDPAWVAELTPSERLIEFFSDDYAPDPETSQVTKTYTIVDDAPVESGDFTVTLHSGTGYELDAATSSATVEIVAADPLITVRAEQADYPVAENHGTLTVTLIAETIAGAPKPREPLQVSWAAVAGTATGGGADFGDAGGIAALGVFGESEFTAEGVRWVATMDVEVTVVDDSTWELDETFHIALSRHSDTHPLVKLANTDRTLCASGVNCGATVTILSNDNTAPEFSNSSETREVEENSPPGTDVGAPVTATDGNTGAGDALTYSLEGADAASFAIHASTGQITTRAGVDYDFETDPSYSVTVKATDRQDASATVAVTINLIDVDVEVDPAPLSALSLTGIEFNETFEAGVTAYTASVPHAATRTTVSATPETSGATVTILPADASGSLSGHQVDLGVGDTAITVKVESTGARSVYSVTVTRSGPEVLPPLKPGQELVKSFEMVAGAGNAGGVVYGYGAAASGDSLTPTEFEWGGVTYRVTEILVNVDLAHLFVKLDPHPTKEAMAGLSLHIGADADKDGERISFWVLQFSGSTRESNSFSWGFAPAFGPYTNPFGREERAGTTVNLRLVTTETTAPILETHTVSGSTLTLTYDELLDEKSEPAPGAFVVSVAPDGGTPQRREVTAVVVDGVTVTLTLASPVAPGDTITVVYTVPASDPIQDQVGNDAAAINITIELLLDQTGVCNRAIQQSGRCDLSTATTLTPGVPLAATVAEPEDVAERNDVDWFRVELEANTVYRIDMEGAPTNKGTLRDPYLSGMYAVFAESALGGYQDDGSLDGDGEDIETIWYSLHGDCAAGERSSSTNCELFDEGTYYNDDGGVGYNARLYLRGFPTGAHYVEARGLGPATGTYTITLTEVTDDITDDPRTLRLSEETSAVIDFPDDSDTFEIDGLTAGTTYTITLRSQGWDGWSDIDIDSAVHTTTPGVEIDTPYTSSTDTYTITPATTGTHRLKIVGRNWGRHQRFATGEYTITITEST